MSAPRARLLDRVRTRLLGAFLALGTAALALAVVGWMGMQGTQRALSGFEDDLLPAIAQSLQLAERAAQLAALAPRLTEPRDPETLEADVAGVQELLQELRRRSEELPAAGELRPSLAKLLPVVERDVAALVAAARQKRAVHVRFQEQLARLDRLGAQLQGRTGTPVDSRVAAIWSNLLLGSAADSAATLGRQEAEVEALLVAARRHHALDAYDPAVSQALSDVATGRENLLSLRRDVLELERRTGLLVILTRTVAEDLSDEVARNVAALRATAAARSQRVRSAVRSGESWLLTLAAVCLVIAAGSTRFVGRLVEQIERITDVMSRLAKGDTAQPTPATSRRDELGALARTFEVFRDNLLAKQQAVADLKLQRELLEAVHNSMTDGLAVFDAAGRLLLWNPQLEAMLLRHVPRPHADRTARELLAALPPDTVWEAPGRTPPRPLAELHADPLASGQIELRLAGGQVLDLRTRAMPGGGSVTLATDQTARRAVEVQLQQAQRLEVLGQLTGGVAHDFNNYLGTILGNLSLLDSWAEAGSAADARAQLQRARHAATSAAALTRRLLAFARRQPLQAERVAVDGMIEEMRDLVEYSAGPHTVVTFELGAGQRQLHVDRGQLENALLNLVLNSAAAMPAGGTLAISTRPATLRGGDPAVALAVADSGTGIPEHLQDKVFEPFFTTKTAGGGSGLGLSIVYGFVKQSGGEIALASRPGGGTTVVLTFPAAGDAVEAEPRSAPSPARPVDLAGLSLLLVDDDEAFRTTVVDMMTRAGVQVRAFATAEEALAALERGAEAEALLSDVCLGAGLDGLGLAQAVRARHPAAAVGLMSGLSPELLAQRGAWSDAFPFLQKPFTPEALLSWLERLVSGVPEGGARGVG